MTRWRKSIVGDFACLDGYGKALERREGRAFALYSYGTRVCTLDDRTLKLTRLWDGYSATTMRHVNLFLSSHGLEPVRKPAWDKMPVGVPQDTKIA